MEPRLAEILEDVRRASGKVVALTGAGISAESGIPTFRGTDGYWVVGSRNYMPQEMATREMFERAPEEVWRWYLYRFGVCRHAAPNAGHAALVRLERALGDRFTLVTQNIDGLHRRAGLEAGLLHPRRRRLRALRGRVRGGPAPTSRPSRSAARTTPSPATTGPGSPARGATAGSGRTSSGSTSTTTRSTTGWRARSAPPRRRTSCWWWARAAPPTSPCSSAGSPSPAARPWST